METTKKLETLKTEKSESLRKPSLVDAKGALLKAGFVLGSAAIIIICLRNSLTWHVARYATSGVITKNKQKIGNN